MNNLIFNMFISYTPKNNVLWVVSPTLVFVPAFYFIWVQQSTQEQVEIDNNKMFFIESSINDKQALYMDCKKNDWKYETEIKCVPNYLARSGCKYLWVKNSFHSCSHCHLQKLLTKTEARNVEVMLKVPNLHLTINKLASKYPDILA